MTDEPKKGKEWLSLKLREGASRLWHEPSRQRFGFRFNDASVIDTRNPQPARSELGQMADEAEAIRKSLRASDAIAMLSIRVTARDWKRRGRTVETWLKCSLIRRLIERPKPTRERIGHDRYSILISFLVAHGIAEPDVRNGYVWTPQYKTLSRRAEWLAELTHREGDLRNLRSAHRYSITFE
jgi:hypothetical protein